MSASRRISRSRLIAARGGAARVQEQAVASPTAGKGKRPSYSSGMGWHLRVCSISVMRHPDMGMTRGAVIEVTIEVRTHAGAVDEHRAEVIIPDRLLEGALSEEGLVDWVTENLYSACSSAYMGMVRDMTRRIVAPVSTVTRLSRTQDSL